MDHFSYAPRLLTSLDHIVIGVRDLEGGTQTLGRLLGRRPSWRGSHPTFGTANTLFRPDKTYVELLAPRGEGAIADVLRDWLERRGEGLFAVAFGTTAADESARELRPARARCRRSRRRFGPISCRPRSRATTPPRRSTRRSRRRPHHRRRRDERALWAEARPPPRARRDVSRLGHAPPVLPGRRDHRRDRRPLGAKSEASDRLWGISYQVADVEPARARLSREGFDVSEVRTGRKLGTFVTTVRGDPFGVATLLIQPVAH